MGDFPGRKKNTAIGDEKASAAMRKKSRRLGELASRRPIVRFR